MRLTTAFKNPPGTPNSWHFVQKDNSTVSFDNCLVRSRSTDALIQKRWNLQLPFIHCYGMPCESKEWVT